MSNEHSSLSELWGKHRPPATAEKAGHDINMSVCRAAGRTGKRYGQHQGLARRGCGELWGRVKNNALLYTAVHPEAWERVRLHGHQPPVLDGDRCLWLLAAAWRVVQWLDSEDLTQAQVIALRTTVTNLKAGVTSLPTGFAIEAEEQLREDERERAKPAGPDLVPAKAKKTDLPN